MHVVGDGVDAALLLVVVVRGEAGGGDLVGEDHVGRGLAASAGDHAAPLLGQGADAAVALQRLLAGLREGKRFSSLLAEQPDVFPPLYVGIVRAAEGTSDLPRSLQRYVDYQARIDTVRNKLISSAIYPSILFVVGGGVSTFLIAFVVPRFATIYEGTGRSLPWMSQILLDWGKFASAHGLPLLAAPEITLR